MPDQVKVYKMYAQAMTSTDAAASYDVQEDGEICSVLLDIIGTADDALNDGGGSEVSFASVSGFSTNDTRASIVGGRQNQGFLTSGGGPVGKSVFITFAPYGIPVAAGERLYLHIIVTGTSTITCSAWVYHCITGGPLRASVSRRGR